MMWLRYDEISRGTYLRAVFKPGLGLAAALLPRQIPYMTRSKMRQKTLVQHQTVESLVQSLYNYNTFS